MSTTEKSQEEFTNWAGNLSCRPHLLAHPTSEAEVAEILQTAVRQGRKVRVAGAGHSFSPIHMTDDVLVVLDRMAGITSADSTTARVVCKPGTRIRDFGDLMWDAGLCLKNQGDIDTQHIVGAMQTATHGSGRRLQSFAASATRLRIVTASGETIEVDEGNPDLLAAAQVSLGLLGIITEVEFEARERFAMGEHDEFWPLDRLLEEFDEQMATRRHFSYLWMPASDSPDRLFMPYPADLDVADWARVKRYDELPADVLDEGPEVAKQYGYTRLDRPYRIYPDPDFQGEIMMRELEYMVPFEHGKDAFLALRELVLTKYPENKYPIEIRSVAAEDAWLSPFYQRDSIAVSICGHKPYDFMAFLADVGKTLDPLEPRPHWGKIHFLDRDRLVATYPRYEDFEETRRRMDTGNVLLSPSMAKLFR